MTDEAKTPEAAVTALTKSEEAEASKRWEEKIGYFREAEKSALRNVLRLYWERGQFAAELFDNPKHWGNRTAETLARELSRKGRQIHQDEVRQWHRFYTRYTDKELEKAVDQGITWHAVQSLISIDDKSKRLELQTKLSEGSMTAEGLRSAVKETNAAAKKSGKKKENRGGKAASSVFRNVTSAAVEFQKRLDEYRDSMKLHDKMDEEAAQKSQIDQRRKEARKALVVVARKLEAALAYDEPGK